jgi:hypothetical protein
VVRRRLIARKLALLSPAGSGRKNSEPIAIDGLDFGSLGAAGAAEIGSRRGGFALVEKAKARSIRAGLWHCVISIERAKTLPRLLLAGNDRRLTGHPGDI